MKQETLNWFWIPQAENKENKKNLHLETIYFKKHNTIKYLKITCIMHCKIVWGNVKQMHSAANPIIHNHTHRNTHHMLMNRSHKLLLPLTHTHTHTHIYIYIWCKSQHLLHPYAPITYTDANRCWKNRSKQADYWQYFTHREQTFIQSTLEKTWPVLYKAWRGAHSINSGWVMTWCVY